MWRAALTLVSALTGGVALGRQLLGKEVDKQKHKAIQAAAIEARTRIRDHAETYLSASTATFARVTAIKAVLLLALWLAHFAGLLPDRAFYALILGLLAAYMVRDILVTWPVARLALREIRNHGLRPKRALSEVVAAQVFEQVLAEAAAREDTRITRVIMRLAGANKDALSLEVAEAVADVARQNTWRDLRPFVLAWAVKFVLLSALYGGFVFVLMRLG